jgi:hypothetical protein
MVITAFHFTKLSAEKTKNAPKKVSVSNKVILTDVKEAKLAIGSSKQKAIEFSFDYVVEYAPEAGNVLIQGALLYVAAEAKVKETMEKWKKEKKLPDDVLLEVYNPILEKCSVETLLLARDVLLAPHITLPKMSAK